MKKLVINCFLIGMVLFGWCWIANGGEVPTLSGYLLFVTDKVKTLLSALLCMADLCEWLLTY